MIKDKNYIRQKNRDYYNGLIKLLSKLIVINSMIYMILSDRVLGIMSDSDIDFIVSASGFIKENIFFPYEIDTFACINFILIAFVLILALFGAKKLPIILSLVMLFILKYDSDMYVLLNGLGVKLKIARDSAFNNEVMTNIFVNSEYSKENIQYAVAILIPLYTFIKINLCDAIIIGINKNKKKRLKNTGKTSTPYIKKSAGYVSTPSSFVGSDYDATLSNSIGGNYGSVEDDIKNSYYSDDDDYYYNQFSQEKDVIKVYSDYDKERVCQIKNVDPGATVIDENGREYTAWEYANNYESEKRMEEERQRFLEDQYFYDSNNNNSYHVDDGYGDLYNNNYGNDYYSQDNYGGINVYDDNDSYF